ncbi:unnamed protein product [Ranitomeya imitator]|uniref:THUMP domain-containing protein n=1 Tax=Ranitomeya imitator TaxID=111125 RepID=A0ABN9KYZ9_9NEOB|nr:unnamed protein product [Ranitomeya imitator]
MQGILITCNMNGRKCVGEAYSLLNEYGDLLYGAEKLEKFVHHILKDLNTTKKTTTTRVIYRMLPVTGTCKAFPEDLKKCTEMFFHPWFKAPNKGTFQIVYKARNNNHMNREEVIKDLAGLVGNLNPENKVDLTNPEFTIVVEIIRNVCCLSVVKDYTLFKKYNLQEVVKSAKEEKPQEPAGENRRAKQKGPCSGLRHLKNTKVMVHMDDLVIVLLSS